MLDNATILSACKNSTYLTEEKLNNYKLDDTSICLWCYSPTDSINQMEHGVIYYGKIIHCKSDYDARVLYETIIRTTVYLHSPHSKSNLGLIYPAQNPGRA